MSQTNLPQPGQKVCFSPYSTSGSSKIYVVEKVICRSHQGNDWAPNPVSYHVVLEGTVADVPVEILFPVDD